MRKLQIDDSCLTHRLRIDKDTSIRLITISGGPGFRDISAASPLTKKPGLTFRPRLSFNIKNKDEGSHLHTDVTLVGAMNRYWHVDPVLPNNGEEILERDVMIITGQHQLYTSVEVHLIQYDHKRRRGYAVVIEDRRDRRRADIPYFLSPMLFVPIYTLEVFTQLREAELSSWDAYKRCAHIGYQREAPPEFFKFEDLK